MRFSISVKGYNPFKIGQWDVQRRKKSPFGKGEAPKEQGIFIKNFLVYNPLLLKKLRIKTKYDNGRKKGYGMIFCCRWI